MIGSIKTPYVFTDHVQRFKAIAGVPFGDLTQGELREMHDMACDLIHCDDIPALERVVDERRGNLEAAE